MPRGNYISEFVKDVRAEAPCVHPSDMNYYFGRTHPLSIVSFDEPCTAYELGNCLLMLILFLVPLVRLERTLR